MLVANLFTCGVHLDLQKAFGTVNHEILLSKLKHYGIKGTLYNWFKSFLCERMLYTSIKESESSLKAVSHGLDKALYLGCSYLSSSSSACTIQFIVKYITMWMTQICS